MSGLPVVRIAEPRDEDEIIAMCRRLHDENGVFKLNDDKVRKQIRRCFNQEGTIVGVIGKSGAIEASTCFAISDFYYTDDWHLAELWNYVEEPYRKSHNIDALIEFGKECADKMKLPLFTGIITDKHMAGKVRLYRRKLGRPVGAYFLYGAKWTKPFEPMEPESTSALRERLLAMALRFQGQGMSRGAVRDQLIPLLREAAQMLKRVEQSDDLWAAAVSNGQASPRINGIT
jgi:hypothetical protein